MRTGAILALLLYLLLCTSVAWLARRKNRRAGLWFLLALLLTPAVGLAAVIAAARVPDVGYCRGCGRLRAGREPCHYCGDDSLPVARERARSR
jgi:hypothetical protein